MKQSAYLAVAAMFFWMSCRNAEEIQRVALLDSIRIQDSICIARRFAALESGILPADSSSSQHKYSYRSKTGEYHIYLPTVDSSECANLSQGITYIPNAGMLASPTLNLPEKKVVIHKPRVVLASPKVSSQVEPKFSLPEPPKADAPEKIEEE